MHLRCIGTNLTTFLISERRTKFDSGTESHQETHDLWVREKDN